MICRDAFVGTVAIGTFGIYAKANWPWWGQVEKYLTANGMAAVSADDATPPGRLAASTEAPAGCLKKVIVTERVHAGVHSS